MRALAGKLLIAFRRSWTLSAALSLVPMLAILASIAQRHGPPNAFVWLNAVALLALAPFLVWAGVSIAVQALYRPRRSPDLTLLQNLQNEHRLDYAPVDAALGLDPLAPEDPEPWPTERRLLSLIGRPLPGSLAQIERFGALLALALVLSGLIGVDLAGRADALLIAVGADPVSLSNWTLLLGLWTLAVVLALRGLAQAQWAALSNHADA